MRGWAIPTATDIAFALAVLAVVGRCLPSALRTFLLTLAVVDDLLAIVIIAVFYTADLSAVPLLAAAVPLGVFAVLVQRRVRSWWLLLPLAFTVWALVHASGVHATVAGVLLAFAVPVRRSPDAGPGPGLAEHFEHRFRPISAGVAVPIFALLSAGVTLGGLAGLVAAVTDPIAVGIMLGLVVGKPVGILAATWLTARFTHARLDSGLAWIDVAGLAVLSGVGFAVWRTGTAVAVLLGVWSLLAVTRTTRGEEDAGRWDLLLAGRLPAHRLIAGQLTVVAAFVAGAGLAVTVVLIAVGTPPAGAVLHGAGLALLGLFCAGVAGVAAQLFPARPAATGAATGVLAVGLLLRMVGDGSSELAWLRWLSPFGLLELTRPYEANRWLPLAVLAGAALTSLAAAAVLVRGRDIRDGRLPVRTGRRPRPALLGGVTRFAVRRTLRPLAGWAVDIGAYYLLIGLIAESMTRFLADNPRFAGLAGFGGLDTVEGYAATLFALLPMPVGGYVAVRLATLAADETDRRLTLLYAGPVTRRRLLAGEVAAATGGAVALTVTAAVATWAGIAAAGGGLGLPATPAGTRASSGTGQPPSRRRPDFPAHLRSAFQSLESPRPFLIDAVRGRERTDPKFRCTSEPFWKEGRTCRRWVHRPWKVQMFRSSFARRTVVTVVAHAAVLAVLLPTPAQAAPVGPAQLNAADVTLLNGVRLAGSWEMPAGQMAAEKGSSARVRQVGQEIANQHVELHELAVQAANQIGAVSPTAERAGWLDEMKNATGRQFDQIFVDRLRAAHGKIFPVIGAVRASTRNPAVRKLADEANTFVMNHLQLLESTGLVRYERLPPAALPPEQDVSAWASPRPTPTSRRR